MKNFEFNLSIDQADWIFKPIRTKLDTINIMMRVIKMMLTYQPPAENKVAGHFSLIVDAMSRIIFVSEKKIYSLNFPFRVKGNIGNFHFYNHHHQDVNSKATSSILAFINEDGIFNELDILDFANPIVDSTISDQEIWSLLRELLLWEEGYIRYDDDLAHINGDVHPRHHFDIFYSSSATFKIGLRKSIEHNFFSDMLNVNTDCRFI